MTLAIHQNMHIPAFQPVEEPQQDTLIKRVWTAVVDFFKAVAEKIKMAAAAVWAFVVRVWTVIIDFFKAVVEKIKMAAEAIWTFIKTSLCGGINPQEGFVEEPGVIVAEPGAVEPAPPAAVVHVPRPIPMSDIPAHILQSLEINPAALARRPKPFDPAPIIHIANNTVPIIHADQIIQHFNQQFARLGEDAILYNDQGNDITVARARDSIQTQYLNYIRDNMGVGGYSKSVAENFELFLKAIIFELRKAEVPVEKKQEALKNLASAAEHCVPRRHEQAFKIYRTLSNQMETLEDIVLQYVQQTKEDLFYNFYSLSREPVQTLNYIRATVGQELGLDCNEVHLNDPHINLNDASSPENRWEKHRTPAQFRNVFNRIYTPVNLLSIMKNFLNQRIAQDNDFTREVSAFIDNELQRHQRAGDLTKAEMDNLPAPYQFDLFDNEGNENKTNPYHLTDEGIRFLMVHFGMLRTDVPNIHLVRAQPAAPVAVAVA